MMWEESEKFLKKDKHIGPLVENYGHCEIVKRSKSQYFTSLVKVIVGQQLSVKAAATIYGRLEGLLKMEVTPENVLWTRKDRLRKVGLSEAKTKYVKDLARRVSDGNLDIHKMDHLDNETILKELIEVIGIGKWTAEMFMMFSLARPDIFPVDDLGLRNGFKRVVGDYKPERMVKYAQMWSPWRTIASWYLWRSLENEPDS